MQRPGIITKNTISEITRRAIFDYITTAEIDWAGRLQEDDFLARLCDLTKMHSTDNRRSNAAGDIHQHRVSWRDWDDDWVFYDPRFNLLHASDQRFLRFLCETIHPVVRPDTDEANSLADAYNTELAPDGWQIIEAKQISGKPVYAYQKTGSRVDVFEEPTGWQKVDRQIQEMRMRLDTAETEEQFQAVGLLCREVLISVAQEAYNPSLHESEGDVSVSKTDAKRMIDGIIEAELQGQANEEARAHAKAANRLALALQHKRTAGFRMAALSAEATLSVVNIVAVLSNRRGRLT